MKKFTFRKFINDIHLWLGIGSGLILFIICLTGTIYVFAKEITDWMDKEKVTISVPENANTIPVTELVALLEKEKKDTKVTGIQIPEGKDRSWLFTLTPKDILLRRSKEEREAKLKEGKREKSEGRKASDDKSRQKGRGADKDSKAKNEKGKGRGGDRERIKTYYVNPYTGEVLGDTRTTSSKFFLTIMGLHRWLLLDHDIGRPITGTATLIFIFMEITGLILWLPAKLKSWKKWSAWKAGFKIKTEARWKRINHDLHNTLGFYTFLLLTLMALTGLCFSFEWFRNGVGNVFGAKPFEDKKAVASVQSEYAGANPLSLDLIITKANEVYPYNGDLRLSLPKDSVGPVIVYKAHTGFIASAGTDRLYLDQYTGYTLKKEPFSDKRTGEQIVALIYPLHVGEVFGTFTKIIYFIACLIATSLPVTGTFIWINKLRKKSEKNERGKTKKKSSKKDKTSQQNASVELPVMKSDA
ncbi:iron uptake protein [Sporocytophaga myxococcoides]|uniref:Iron uptake protein n=1 Tax=Sporocytophaga myxococcoides TaxID=153721 RepID=A0A098L994_9BACT|nr:PepSY-associated TM helix domain-containing protein [Sporocytophaga myxococcoides]GAL83167.1 iron uptake protein [Sporocytophaga myxococcoides]